MAEFFTGLRILRAEPDDSRSTCKLVVGEHDAALEKMGAKEGVPPEDELQTMFALREFLREFERH